MGHCHGLLSRDVLAKIFEFGQESVTWTGISIPHRQDCVWPKVGPFSFRALTRKGHIEKRGLKWKGSSPSVQNTKHHHTHHHTQHQNQNQPPTPTESYLVAAASWLCARRTAPIIQSLHAAPTSSSPPIPRANLDLVVLLINSACYYYRHPL